MRNYYTKLSLTLFIALVFSISAFSQSRQSLWSKTNEGQIESNDLVFRKSTPTKADFYSLDIRQLKQQLQNAPERNEGLVSSNVLVDFPNADGTFETFKIYEASIMESELQLQYSNIRSYVGFSIENPETLIRFSVTPKGLHTMTLSTDMGSQFIDPYTKNSNIYIVYSKKNLPFGDRNILCEFDDEGLVTENLDPDAMYERNANDGQMRNFRLALACTVEYASFHWMAAGLTGADTVADRKDAVLEAMVITMTRVNGLYERELSVTMTIIANNLDIIFITSDTYSNENGSLMLGQNQTTIDTVIGSGNYDIGHVFSTGGGGIASLNSPCVAGSKARGVTGLPNPVGDAFDIDFVAHEMGHQYGAPHTFNGDTGNCAGNRSSSNAYEPGSGSTIMAYAGICAPQNVQSNSDAYFHQKSLQMIWANITGGNSQCAQQTSTGNTAPLAEAGTSYIVPQLTPYKLTGSSTDVDGTDGHTYTWEQWDLGPSGIPTETTATGPLVRSFQGTTNPSRYIPNLPDLMSNSGSTDWEKLSSVNRDINFQLTVRDNDIRGGQTSTDNMTVNVTTAAGPFVVTSQNTDQIVWTPGETETIVWDVAGTNTNGVNESNVNILLSTSDNPNDDDFVTVLAANVPNNGSYEIIVPDISAPYCRIMVEASNNIFFAINTEPFAIGNYVYGPVDVCTDYAFNAGVLLEENDMTFSGFNLPVSDTFIITDLNISLDVTTTNNAEIFSAVRGPWELATDPLHFLARGTCDGATDLILTFDDEGVATDCNDTASNNNVLPFDPLSFADGQDSAGNWVIFIGDVIVDGNRATWNSATLTICEEGVGPILGVDTVSIEDYFSIYPNPNNGQFTIKLKSKSGEDINVEVFDVRGRSILKKSYSNTGDFNQTINLENAQSGMYLLNINDGNQKLTKKIIVN